MILNHDIWYQILKCQDEKIKREKTRFKKQLEACINRVVKKDNGFQGIYTVALPIGNKRLIVYKQVYTWFTGYGVTRPYYVYENRMQLTTAFRNGTWAQI